jgi:catechol 2,3-dioxygenase-like lactoylglutathione lyase family enzyme
MAEQHIGGLHHVQLSMPAGGEAQARVFYGSLLGLAEIAKPARLAARGGVWFQCGSIQLHLGVDADFVPAKKAHPGLLVGSLPELIAALTASGHEVKYDTERLAGFDRAFTADPFGNRIELLQLLDVERD